MFKIGITGTRNGMTPKQRKQLEDMFNLFKHTYDEFEFHHGDCVGVDVQAADLAQAVGFRTVCHPPVKEDLRAFHQSDEIREPHTYFKRNRNIVDETEVLLVVPFESSPQSKGGTWYTHDYAVKGNSPVLILWP